MPDFPGPIFKEAVPEKFQNFKECPGFSEKIIFESRKCSGFF
jgi:hypothetical protein